MKKSHRDIPGEALEYHWLMPGIKMEAVLSRSNIMWATQVLLNSLGVMLKEVKKKGGLILMMYFILANKYFKI